MHHLAPVATTRPNSTQHHHRTTSRLTRRPSLPCPLTRIWSHHRQTRHKLNRGEIAITTKIIKGESMATEHSKQCPKSKPSPRSCHSQSIGIRRRRRIQLQQRPVSKCHAAVTMISFSRVTLTRRTELINVSNFIQMGWKYAAEVFDDISFSRTSSNGTYKYEK